MDKQETFLNKARNVHGNLYDYSKSIYIKSHAKIIITCREHGDFIQTAGVHLRGCGCPICAKNKMGNHKMETGTLVEKLKNKYGDKYSYEFVNFVNSFTKISVVCKKHGKFDTLPNNILRGHGCPYCKKEKSRTGRFNYAVYDLDLKKKKDYNDNNAEKKWDSMLKRCYYGKQKSYDGCIVCNEWAG